MDQGQIHFSKRLRRLDRKHRAMARGYETCMRPDGLIVAKPNGSRPRLPIKPLIFLAACFVLFKAFLMTQLGPVVYAERVERLAAGTVVEQAGAWAMQSDPASEWVARQISSGLPDFLR